MTPASRLNSIDIVRGIVMILMAIDHVRVYSAIPSWGTTPDIYFTRWITHFCAPAFVFLAGTSAYFFSIRAPRGQGQDGRTPDDLRKFLFTRGLWLIILELTVLRIAWTFNFDFAAYNMAGVIWVIGWSMIILAGLAGLPFMRPAGVGIIGLLIIAGHNILNMEAISGSLGDDAASALWKIFYIGFWAGPIQFGPEGPNLIVLYSIIPWAGVMTAGYGFGKVLAMPAPRRDRLCYLIGGGATLLFVMLRGFNLYGDPWPWSAPSAEGGEGQLPALFSFLGTNKYPASFLFLLMTLGPTVALMPLFERASGALSGALAVFGRVPFFYYALHIPLIHTLACVVSFLSDGQVSGWLFMNHPMGAPPAPEGYVWNLGTLYLVWAVVIGALYIPCRWFAAVKARRKDWWLGYL